MGWPPRNPRHFNGETWRIPRRWLEAGLGSREIEQDHIRVLLHSFQDNLAAVWRDVEVANVKVGRDVGQLPLGARLQIDEPEILMLNVSSQEHECTSSGQERQVSSPSSQGQCRQGMRCGFCRDRLHRKRRADVGSRVDNKRPSGAHAGSTE